MELNKCSRCGSFYFNEGDVCSKCASKDIRELATFNNYIEQNGLSSIDTIVTATGITQKNVNRYISYQGIQNSVPSESENPNPELIFN